MPVMTNFFAAYMVFWSAACLIAIGLMVHSKTNIELFQRPYWAGLFQPWKLTTFIIATTGLVFISPYTGDPTWDYFDSFFMSLMTYATAPWAVGTFYLTIRGLRPYTHSYIAACIWMFSASWSYDLYLVIRDGDYPITWLSNIFASSVLYACAGLFWSLESVENRGVIFNFMDPRWPSALGTAKATGSLMWYALPFMLLVSAMIIPFLL